MVKSFLIAAALVVSAAAQAHTTIGENLFAAQVAQIKQAVTTESIGFKAGDECDYKLNIGGFLNGTMIMSIREVTADGVWMVQDVDLQIQKQKIEALIDPNTGEVKKLLVDGKEQAVPKNDIEIVDQKQEQVTVPAGTFDTIHITIKDKANNNEQSEQWVNPRDIPVAGMVKSLANSQIGKVTMELTSFKK